MQYDVIVIGGGAAGLFCALTAGRRGRRVLVVEHNPHPAAKIKISGGGRCNFTNLRAGPDNYISGHPAFCRSALARFTPEDFLALVDSHGIRHHEKTPGQLFCNGSSREIIDMLLGECAQAGVVIRCGVRVTEVQPGFRISSSAGEFSCASLVIATGGLSFPKLGATDFGYRMARQFGMAVTALRPGLVPLVLGPDDLADFSNLSGLSLRVRISTGARSFEDALLVTHRGFSGPSILQASSYWDGTTPPVIDLAPGARPAGTADLSAAIPRRFAEVWSSRHAPAKPDGQWSARERTEFQNRLHHWPVGFAGTEGYPKAEVTVGGVDTGGLSSKTMESRTQSGLYFIGEVVDVTGWLGGYNFQWAWASGHAAGSAA